MLQTEIEQIDGTPADGQVIIRISSRLVSAKAVQQDGEYKLLVLGAPYGSPQDKDEQGEFFSPRTDFLMDIGDTRPAVYFHGLGPNARPLQKPQVIGKAKAVKRDDKGLWFEVILDMTKALAKRVWDAAVRGVAKASSGAINYLARTAPNGEVLTWALGELTLLDEGLGRVPANDKAVAFALKSVYSDASMEIPEEFSEGLELKADSVDPESVPTVVEISAITAAVLDWFDKQDAVAQAQADLYARARAEVESEIEAAVANSQTPVEDGTPVEEEAKAKPFRFAKETRLILS